MKNLFISSAAAVVIAIIGWFFIQICPVYQYTNPPVLYLATVIGGGCCWIGLNLRKK